MDRTGRGYYQDQYVRTSAGWKFASRVLTLSHYAPADASNA